ncbi:DegT/DnrJ/EryC1/StrS family aminotransferase [Polynucleobacter sp. AM-7D1]|uniref:DegT/DnrJ/EryC1/StrS family aminotransferase n=1 Tax=Polynucleobacter sp. AM-7D1 TaxID=2689102 RepID=UPI001BFD3D01|nr:DegT/DnrJ/EryC1/StrS family aminotransferase [Polynucleobacter sp. AM-7D1]
MSLLKKITTKKNDLYARLIDLLGGQFKRYDWYCFGNARGALAFMLRTAGIGIGDEVIISAYTCLAVPTAILSTGATPVYVDINIDSLSINVEKIKDSVTPSTRAIVVQHTLGNIFPVADLKSQSWSKGILIIEDCALSIGSRINGSLIGLEGDAAIFSMELSKTLSTGWGGLLLISNAAYVDVAKNLYSRLPSQNTWHSLLDFFQTAVSGISYHPAFFQAFGKYVIGFFYKIGFFRNSTSIEELAGLIPNGFVSRLGIAQVALAEIQWLKFSLITNACAKNFIEIAREARRLGYRTHIYESDNQFCVSNRVSLMVQNPTQMLEYFKRQSIDLGRWFDGPLSPLPVGWPFNYEPDKFPFSQKVARHIINIPSHSRLSIVDRKKIIKVLRSYTSENPDSISVY